MFAHGETGVRLRPFATLDPYSEEEIVEDWEAAYELSIPGLAFNPGSSNEPTEVGRNSVVTQPEVYAHVGDDILAGDRLRIRGLVFQVDGDPQEWRSPFTGWEAGLVVKLKRVEG